MFVENSRLLVCIRSEAFYLLLCSTCMKSIDIPTVIFLSQWIDKPGPAQTLIGLTLHRFISHGAAKIKDLRKKFSGQPRGSSIMVDFFPSYLFPTLTTPASYLFRYNGQRLESGLLHLSHIQFSFCFVS